MKMIIIIMIIGMMIIMIMITIMTIIIMIIMIMIMIIIMSSRPPFSPCASARACTRKEPARFDSFRFRTFRKFIGSVRFSSVLKIRCPGSTRFGLRFSNAPWLGPVRFGSASGSGRIQNLTVRFDSVQPVRLGFLFLPAVPLVPTRSSCSC